MTQGNDDEESIYEDYGILREFGVLLVDTAVCVGLLGTVFVVFAWLGR